MKEIKPKRVAGDKPGVKIDDYWDVGKAMLHDPPKFLESLFKYDRDNIPESVITKIQPYIDSEDFLPTAIAKVSKACTSICQWVRAMHKFHFVSKAVAPKRVSSKGTGFGVQDEHIYCVRGKTSFYWSSERHSEHSPPRKDATNKGKSWSLGDLVAPGLGRLKPDTTGSSLNGCPASDFSSNIPS